MTKDEQACLGKLDIRVGNLERGQEEILTNHLPHLEEALGKVQSDANSAKFRAGAVIYGLAFIGVMITILGVMVAVR
jgi:hypothetical protein